MPTAEEQRLERQRIQAQNLVRRMAEDPEKVRAANRDRNERYREANRDGIKQRHAQWERDNPDAVWAKGLRYRHGMTPDDWDQMWREQEGCCYLCGDPLDSGKPKSVHIDHDQRHCPPMRSCEVCRRGLAHSRCNRLLAVAADDPAWLRRVADSLEAANAAVAARKNELPLNVRRLERRKEGA